ncbi:MAG: hypothetical protein WC269_04585, partial [Candidatus Gracilibacteria bacterium]
AIKDGSLAPKLAATSLPTPKDLEQAAKILQKDSSFSEKFKQGFLDMLKLYAKIIKSPKLLVTGTVETCKDIFVELPKSLLKKQEYPNDIQRLEAKSSQALGISEVATVPGTYAGIALLESLGVVDKIAGPVGAALGNYIAGVLSFMVSYALLTRSKSKNYSIGTSLKDSFSTVKNCFPAAVLISGANGPIVKGFMQLGLSETVAATIAALWGVILFVGVAKTSIKENIEKKPPVL